MFFQKNKDEDDTFITKRNKCLEEVYDEILNIKEAFSRQTHTGISPEVIVMFAEIGLKTKAHNDHVERALQLFF